MAKDKVRDRQVREKMSKMADDIESYMELFDRFVIPTEMSEATYTKNKKTIKKLVKKLRSGDITCFRDDVQDDIYEKLLG